MSAKERELQSLAGNKLCKTVLCKNQQCVSVRLVCTMKANKNGLLPISATGFEEDILSKSEKNLPTAKKKKKKLLKNYVDIVYQFVFTLTIK